MTCEEGTLGDDQLGWVTYLAVVTELGGESVVGGWDEETYWGVETGLDGEIDLGEDSG